MSRRTSNHTICRCAVEHPLQHGGRTRSSQHYICLADCDGAADIVGAVQQQNFAAPAGQGGYGCLDLHLIRCSVAQVVTVGLRPACRAGADDKPGRSAGVDRLGSADMARLVNGNFIKAANLRGVTGMRIRRLPSAIPPQIFVLCSRCRSRSRPAVPALLEVAPVITGGGVLAVYTRLHSLHTDLLLS